jgi:cell division protein FtsB
MKLFASLKSSLAASFQATTGWVSATKLWVSAFSLWGVFLTGIGATLTGSPGLAQAVRLSSLLRAKEAQVTQMQDELKRLRDEAGLLEKSRVVQQREIRRVLGYAANDEIIFDFTTAESL